MTTDPIADMLTRIRNALQVRHEQVSVPTSHVKLEIARILKTEGYIQKYTLVEEKPQGKIRITLKYAPGQVPAITELQRISSPSRKIYVGRDELPRVKGGLGVAIITTSKGIMSDREARRRKLGGEVMCTVW
ncbi:MAG: 30S ribosomal protein S8 [Armatimonadetes bacterium]|nr:30S ribosomal protein S8 [Armatimonadota bacterium]NIM24267.1 30S ribosomal protein S8 [Armatimonadota bacterium]NIM68136.1 30S ribosomal protein S8 [Armatimonadota bacterium]NIM76598.1 30S ribosomal protein S8 [Armatimonadota bacterium]NIN06341.1 30S ribosomal protein S8 [Armatimonadota bacterium]